MTGFVKKDYDYTSIALNISQMNFLNKCVNLGIEKSKVDVIRTSLDYAIKGYITPSKPPLEKKTPITCVIKDLLMHDSLEEYVETYKSSKIKNYSKLARSALWAYQKIIFWKNPGLNQDFESVKRKTISFSLPKSSIKKIEEESSKLNVTNSHYCNNLLRRRYYFNYKNTPLENEILKKENKRTLNKTINSRKDLIFYLNEEKDELNCSRSALFNAILKAHDERNEAFKKNLKDSKKLNSLLKLIRVENSVKNNFSINEIGEIFKMCCENKWTCNYTNTKVTLKKLDNENGKNIPCMVPEEYFFKAKQEFGKFIMLME